MTTAPTTDTDRFLALAGRLTPRDYAILQALHDHRVMRTDQIGQAFFTAPTSRNVRRRLLLLHRDAVITRFRPYAERGSAPLHWVLAPLGAYVLAQHRHTSVRELPYNHETALAVAASSRLGHIVGLAGCFAAFTGAARRTPHARLARWYNEPESARRWGRHVRPDAYVRWDQDARTLHAFVEYDTGSESLKHVVKKVDGYRSLAAATKTRIPSIVLFVVPSGARETHLARALAPRTGPLTPLYLTTHPLLHGPGPAAAIWRGARDDTRLELADLGQAAPAHEDPADGAGTPAEC